MTSCLASYRRPDGWLGRNLRYYPKVASTNDLAVEAGRAGAEAGLVIVADLQTAGKGRLGRRWQAPAGACLLVSMLFRPREPYAYHASRTTMVCGLALAEAVHEVAACPAQLKWPNDLIVTYDALSASGANGLPTSPPGGGWAKLGGMLSEIGLDGDGNPTFLVVGIGLNVNVPTEALAGLAPNATSLLELGGRGISRARLLEHMLAGIERRHAQFLEGEDPLPAWQASLAWMGRPVEVRAPNEDVMGIAIGVDGEGSLLLRLADGRTRPFAAGDVTLRLP